MPIDLIAIAFDQILELAKEKGKRSEKILKALNAIGLKQDAPLDKEFDGVYAYTLVVYGIDKPKPILEFFRHEFVKNSFRKSFEQKDLSILEKETENFLDWNGIGKEILAMDYDPSREFTEFREQFIAAAKLSRTAHEVLVDQSLEDISSGIQELPTRHDLTEQLSNLKNDIIEVSEKASKPKDTFFSPYFRMVQLSDYQPATDDVLKKYYKGELLLSWQILSAKGDVERDIKDDLVHNYVMPQNRVRMLCLSGEAGSGKSTLAWRIATEIAKSTQQPLYQILNSEADEPWNVLESLVQSQGVPLILLADDIFRNAAAQRNLENLNPGLPATIIVTSRSNEVPRDLRLPFSFEIEKMGGPSRTEKNRVLSKLNLRGGDLTIAQRKRLEHATSWLVMMLEITTGESLTNIIYNSITRVRKQDELVYRAYEYMCFAGQYNLAIPETLINSLDDSGKFYNLSDHPASKGLIFTHMGLEIQGHQKNRFQEKMLGVQHPTLARTALKIYQRNPLSIISEFISAIQPDSPEQTFFIGILLYVMILDNQTPLVTSALTENAKKMDEILRESGTTDLIHRWSPIYHLLGNENKVNQLTSIALSKQPKTTADWRALFKIVMQRGTKEQVAQTIDSAKKWLDANPEDTTIRSRYMWLIEKRGDAKQVSKLIDDIGSWLDVNIHDTAVRSQFIDLVKKRGKPEEITVLIENIDVWLESHQDDTVVRNAYIGLVERFGTKLQISNLINDILTWMKNKNDYRGTITIQQSLLGLTTRRGSPDQVSKVISFTKNRLISYPHIGKIIVGFMGLLERYGELQEIRSYIDQMFDWLDTHLNNVSVRSSFLGFVESNGTKEQLERLINDIWLWLESSPNDRNVRVGYISLIGRRGTKEQIDAAIEDTAKWLIANPQNSEVRIPFMKLVETRGTKQQINLLIDDTAQWLKNNPQDMPNRIYYLGLVDRHGTNEQVTKTINETEKWLKEWVGDNGVRVKFLYLIGSRGTMAQKEYALKSTSEWLADNPLDISVSRIFRKLENSVHHTHKTPYSEN